MSPKLFTNTVLIGLVAGSLAGQDDAKAARPKVTRAAKLQMACKAMVGLQDLAFETTYSLTHDPMMAMVRGVKPAKPKAVKAKGVWHRDLLSVKIGDTEEVAFHGRLMIARDDDHEWVLRRGRLASGKPLPFTLDPSTLFANLANMTYKVVHNEVGTIDNKPVETYTIHIDEEDALTLRWSGCLPDEDGRSGSGVVFGGAGAIRVFAAGGGGRAGPKPDVSVDLAISFDPATKMIYRIHGRSMTEGAAGAFAGRVILRRGAGGFFQEEEEEEEEEEEAKEGTFKNGLPVRLKKELKKATVLEFTYTFTKHGDTTPPKLDRRARGLLRT